MTDEDAFCRDVEAYLCRKNDGHLIRIVGPAFELVCGWAARGVPLKVAFRGIDRYFERYYAKGPRRRPVRVEFCDADVLDVFDEWRRAVGVAAPREQPGTEDPTAEETPAAGSRGPSLPAHLDRVIARLVELQARVNGPLSAVAGETVGELEAGRAHARGLRGGARDALVERLRVLDARLLAAARGGLDDRELTHLTGEADGELAPFRERMTAEAYGRARQACIDRLLRERLGLPVVAFD